MKKFSIYEPNPLYLSRTLILYLIIIFLFASAIITQKIYGTHENIVFQTLIFLALGIFIFGLSISVFGMRKTKPLYGKIIGYINFTKEEITIGKNVIKITKIQKIEFEGVDWLGLFEGYQTFSFENKLSNGTKNWIIIYTESSVIKVRFQKNGACELSELKEEFMEYYKLGKISYLQLIDNLCINSKEEQKELKSKK
jgi:hypothetical protein